MMQNYHEFKAVDNTVVGVLRDSPYAEEVTVVVCTCVAIPGLSAEDVAQEIARALSAPCIKGVAFSLPYEDVSEHMKGATDENHTD